MTIRKTNDLHRLLYISESRLVGTTNQVRTEIRSIVATATKINPTRGLTGILLFVQDRFIQVLEGSSDELERTFEAICNDMRHGNLRLLEMTRAEDRLFSAWSMAFVGTNDEPSHVKINRDLQEILVTVAANPAVAHRQMRALLSAQAM